jgi:hypothetical protein
MSTVMKKVVGLAGAVAAGGALLVAAPAAAHASTTTSTTGSVHPAFVFVCDPSQVDVHMSSGVDICFNGGRAWLDQNLKLCGVFSIDTGNNWVAVWWGLSLPTNQYEPGMAPWTVWTPGLPVCVNQLAINT